MLNNEKHRLRRFDNVQARVNHIILAGRSCHHPTERNGLNTWCGLPVRAGRVRRGTGFPPTIRRDFEPLHSFSNNSTTSPIPQTLGLTTQKREAVGYADTLVASILDHAQGSGAASAAGCAAVEVARGLIGRALASAEVEGRRARDVASPAMLHQVGRGLIWPGEVLFVLDIGGERLMARQATAWDVTGSDPWVYRVDLPYPDGSVTRRVGADGLLHFRYATTPATPWVGRGPLAFANLSGDLLAGIERGLSQEAAGASGYVLPLPIEGQTDSDETEKLRSNLRGLRGRTKIVPTSASGMGEGVMSAPRQDWEPRRVGINPPQWLTVLRKDTIESVLAAAGIPVELAVSSTAGADREAWRRFLHSTVAPLGLMVEEELSEKLEEKVKLNFRALKASDIQGAARAAASLAAAGLEMGRALRLAGLMEIEPVS